jgi:hypothetical protein
MAKNKISEFSSTAADNTDITNINIAEGCSPANLNNAVRSLMAVLKSFEDGSSGDNVVVGGNLSVTGTTTLVGTAIAPTPSPGDNSTKIATTAFVQTKVGTLGTMSTQNATAVAITGGTITGITDLAVADGGTGASTLSANAVLLGNGTSALQTVAPSTSGNVLTSDGTTWTSAAPAGIGVGQTWTDVTGSRAIGTTYTNSTGKPIQVSISVNSQTSVGCYVRFYINGSVVARQGSSQNDSADVRANVSLIVPNGNTYKIENADQAGNNGQGQIVLQTWWELR